MPLLFHVGCKIATVYNTEFEYNSLVNGQTKQFNTSYTFVLCLH